MIVDIVKNRKTSYSILIPKKASSVERWGAEELADYLQKALGVSLPILTEGCGAGKAIYVGHTAYAAAAGLQAKAKENWIIRMKDENLILMGGLRPEDRGTLYAVYHFLEDMIGVRWWSLYEEDVPQLQELALAADLCTEGTPFFEMRKVFINRCKINSFDYFARARLNTLEARGELDGGVYNPTVERAGGAIRTSLPNHVHSIGYYIKPEDYFEEHPDWFAWSDVEGKRVSFGHLCFANEEMFHEVLRKLLGYIADDVRLQQEKGLEMPCYYSISLIDTDLGFCECEHCKKVIEKSGRSGYVLQFVNRLAREVAKVYPQAMLETLAYETYIDPPKDDTIPEKNVIIVLAPVDSDIQRDIYAKTNQTYRRLLEAWSGLCKKAGSRLYIWDYMFNLFMPFAFPVAPRLGETFRAFHACGVSGLMIENEYMLQDMWEMNQYLLTHLAENPQADADWLISDFVCRFYGKAAPHIQEYLAVLQAAGDRHVISNCCVRDDAKHNYIDAEAAIKGYACLEKALEAVAGDKIREFRVASLRRTLNVVIVLNYFDLKHMAEKQGQPFSFDREKLRGEILENLRDFQEHPYGKYSAPTTHQIQDESAFFREMVFEEEEIAPLPPELSHVKMENVYQHYFKDVVRMALSFWNRGTGIHFEEDPDSSVSRVMKLSYDESSEGYRNRTHVSGRQEKNPKPLDILIRQDEKTVVFPTLYREDLRQGGYHLYHLGTLKNISTSYDTRLFLLSFNHTWVNISGIAVGFPMDECDVYLSMKFTGAVYGGKPEEENAIYIDRMILVRKA